jgi:adenine phosphoribosyltransferase
VAHGDSGPEAADRIANLTVDVPDFPQPGIVFKDLTPLFADGPAFAATIDAIVVHHGRGSFDVVAGIEARGFMIGAAVAYAAGVGFVPIRKAGKLPRGALSETYALEYGEATIEVHRDAFRAGERVLLIDDVLATGGTAAAALALLARSGAEVAGVTVLMELGFLDGRRRLAPHTVHAVLQV